MGQLAIFCVVATIIAVVVGFGGFAGGSEAAFQVAALALFIAAGITTYMSRETTP